MIVLGVFSFSAAATANSDFVPASPSTMPLYTVRTIEDYAPNSVGDFERHGPPPENGTDFPNSEIKEEGQASKGNLKNDKQPEYRSIELRQFIGLKNRDKASESNELPGDIKKWNQALSEAIYVRYHSLARMVSSSRKKSWRPKRCKVVYRVTKDGNISIIKIQTESDDKQFTSMCQGVVQSMHHTQILRFPVDVQEIVIDADFGFDIPLTGDFDSWKLKMNLRAPDYRLAPKNELK